MADLTAAKLRRKGRKSPHSDAPDHQRTLRDDSITFPNATPSLGVYLMSASGSSARLFIVSLGNPPPLHTTRHSAGHVALRSLITYLNFPTPRRTPSYTGGAVSATPTYTFYQSPTYMNTSGPALLKAWRSFSSEHGLANSGLVILHDELEAPLGQLKVKNGNSSAKGHNGIKSVQASLRGAGLLDQLGQNFVRIGVGIGRPVSREREDVSQFVLGQMTPRERETVEGTAAALESLLAKEAERIGRG